METVSVGFSVSNSGATSTGASGASFSTLTVGTFYSIFSGTIGVFLGKAFIFLPSITFLSTRMLWTVFDNLAPLAIQCFTLSTLNSAFSPLLAS